MSTNNGFTCSRREGSVAAGGGEAQLCGAAPGVRPAVDGFEVAADVDGVTGDDQALIGGVDEPAITAACTIGREDGLADGAADLAVFVEVEVFADFCGEQCFSSECGACDFLPSGVKGDDIRAA